MQIKMFNWNYITATVYDEWYKIQLIIEQKISIRIFIVWIIILLPKL